MNTFDRYLTNETFVRRIKNFYVSKWMFVSIFTFFLLITIVQIYTFVYQGIGLSVVFDDDNMIKFGDSNAYIAWILFFISFIGYFLTFCSTIFAVNHKREFIYYLIVGDILLIGFDLMLGLFFTLSNRFIYLFIGYWNLKHWNKEINSQPIRPELTKKDKWGHLFFTTIYIGAGIPIAIFLFRENTLKGILDVTGASLSISGWYLITKKSKWGIVEYVPANIIYITLFLFLGSWVSSANYAFFLVFDFFSFILWNYEEKVLNNNQATVQLE